jgi:hypothetical protein
MPVSPSSADTNEQNLSLSRNHEFGLDNSYGMCFNTLVCHLILQVWIPGL